MEVIHPRCAGLDVSKKDAKACIRVQGQGRRATSAYGVSTWGSTTTEILALREHLIAEQVSCVGELKPHSGLLEAVSYHLLEDGLDVIRPRQGA